MEFINDRKVGRENEIWKWSPSWGKWLPSTGGRRDDSKKFKGSQNFVTRGIKSNKRMVGCNQILGVADTHTRNGQNCLG